MTDQELGWLTGWLEGEGSFISHTSARGYTRLIVRAVSTDQDVASYAHSIAGGNLLGPYHYPPRQPHWVWTVTKRNDARELMLRLRDLMGRRRQKQIDAALTIGGRA